MIAPEGAAQRPAKLIGQRRRHRNACIGIFLGLHEFVDRPPRIENAALGPEMLRPAECHVEGRSRPDIVGQATVLLLRIMRHNMRVDIRREIRDFGGDLLEVAPLLPVGIIDQHKRMGFGHVLLMWGGDSLFHADTFSARARRFAAATRSAMAEIRGSAPAILPSQFGRIG